MAARVKRQRKAPSARNGWKLDNATSWQQRDLRAFIAEGIRRDGCEGIVRQVRIRYARQTRGCSGWAKPWAGVIQLNLPSPQLLAKGGAGWSATACAKAKAARDAGEPVQLPMDLRLDLAHVLSHEIAHLRGIDHGDMRGGWCGHARGDDWRTSPEFTWAADMPIREAKPKTQTAAQRADAREAKARKLLEQADDRIARLQSQLKRAKTLRAKHAQRVRYYDRKAAAQAPKGDA